MSDQLPPSTQAINPYEASQLAARAQSKGSMPENKARRDYTINMAWADRRHFLRIRLSLEAGGRCRRCAGVFYLVRPPLDILGTRAIPCIERGPSYFQKRGRRVFRICPLRDWAHDVLVLLETCRRFSGDCRGNNRQHADWSQLQWNMARLMIATFVLNVAALGWELLVLFSSW